MLQPKREDISQYRQFLLHRAPASLCSEMIPPIAEK